MVDETNTGDERDVDFSQLEGADISNADDTATAGSNSGGDLEKILAERNDFQDKYLRALADSDNIRKRAIKERSELIKYQGEQIITDLLTVIDDFDLALASSVPESGSAEEKFRQGIEMIHKRFLEVLSKWDVKGESAIGKQFDPAKHEALSRVASADAEPGTVINELKKAFFYKDKLLRPGQVIVAAAPTE